MFVEDLWIWLVQLPSEQVILLFWGQIGIGGAAIVGEVGNGVGDKAVEGEGQAAGGFAVHIGLFLVVKGSVVDGC